MAGARFANANLDQMLSAQLIEIQTRWAEIKPSIKSFTPEIDGQRFVSEESWKEASLRGQKPWLADGRLGFEHFISAVELLNTNKGRNLDYDLYLRLQQIFQIKDQIKITIEGLEDTSASSLLSIKNKISAINKELSSRSTLVDKYKAVIRFMLELEELNKNLGKKNIIPRLLADFLFEKLGLPPTLMPQEIPGYDDINVEALVDMTDYLIKQEFAVLNPDAPLILYHWTNTQALNRMLIRSRAENSGSVIPMKRIRPEADIASAYPVLQGMPGTFMWTDPLESMRGGLSGSGRYEWYVNANSKPKLLAYELDTLRLKYVKVVTMDGVLIHGPENILGFDLVYHQRIDSTYSPVFHEWIVLNPEIVKSWKDVKTVSTNRSDRLMDQHFLRSVNTKHTRQVEQKVLKQINSCQNYLD
jgi:hypothetical protein